MKYRNRKNAEAVARYWGKPLDQSTQWEVKAAGETTTEIILYDVLGWPWNDVAELIHDLTEITTPKILVRINSPGGDVFDGLAVRNALQDHPSQVTTRIEGLAASIASIIAMAGAPVTAHKNAMLMIHEPWVFAIGDQHELRDLADILGKISGNLLDIYYAKTGSDKRKLKLEMEAETWFTAEEAQARKLIDSVIDEPATKAAFDLSMYAHAPDGYRPEGRELDAREIERALRDAGASRSFAKKVVAEKFKVLRDAGVKDIQRQVQHLITILEER